MPSGTVGLHVAAGRDHFGERATRWAMEEWLRGARIEYELASDPTAAGRFASLLICGRAPAALPAGRHSLCAAAVPEGADLAPLAGYAYVSVRSTSDLARVARWRPDAAIVPCVAARLERRAAPGRGRARLGVHLDQGALGDGAGWHEAIRKLGRLEKIFLPLVPEEGGALSRLMHAVGDGRAADVDTVEKAATAIGELRLLVCSSLQAAVIAYMRNVPFLVRSYEPAVGEYLADRGLEAWTFRTPDELLAKALRLLDAAPDTCELADVERERSSAHFELLARALSSAESVAVPESLRAPAAAGPRYAFDGGAAVGSVSLVPSTSEARVQASIAKLDALIVRLHGEVASQRDRIDELAGEVDRLQGEIDRRGAEIDRQASEYAKQALELGARAAEIDRLQAEIDRLHHEVRLREDHLERIRATLPFRVWSALRAIAERLRAPLRRAGR